MERMTEQRKRYDYRSTYTVRFIASAISFGVFIVILFLYLTGKCIEFDQMAGAAIRSLRTPALNRIMIAITHFGDAATIVTIGIVIVIVALVKLRRIDYPLAVTGCFAILGLYTLIKQIIRRPRQDETLWLVMEKGFSFPSGHTMNGTFCYGMMLYLILRNCPYAWVRKLMTVVICILIPLIAFSRIYCGVHYPTDVLAGMSLSFALLMLATVAIDELRLRKYGINE